MRIKKLMERGCMGEKYPFSKGGWRWIWIYSCPVIARSAATWQSHFPISHSEESGVFYRRAWESHPFKSLL